MKLSTALQVFQGLSALAEKDVPVRFGFGVGCRIAVLKPFAQEHDTQVTKLRHRYGLDQTDGVLSGMTPEVKAREVDQEGFQVEYAQLLDQDVDVEVAPILLEDLDKLKNSEGKTIAGLGSIAAKLQPILKE